MSKPTRPELDELCRMYGVSSKGSYLHVARSLADVARAHRERLELALEDPDKSDWEELACACCRANVSGMKFCSACGHQVLVQCTHCAQMCPLLPDSKFCFECGTRLFKAETAVADSKRAKVDSQSSSAPSTPASASKTIELSIRLSDLFDEFERQNNRVGELEYSFQGRTLHPTDTASLLENRDMIRAHII
ncbi:hypothetical protein BASA81_001814 [Batrachochytrium salamandrivorans]|nr:hypothetical protein BASA81_001814 [Batrachochytrium salamandrivorans]